MPFCTNVLFKLIPTLGSICNHANVFVCGMSETELHVILLGGPHIVATTGPSLVLDAGP